MLKKVDDQKKIIEEKSEQETTIPFFKWSYKWNDTRGEYEFESIELSNGRKDLESLLKAVQRSTGSKDIVIGEKILKSIARGMSSDTYHERLNEASAMLAALQPKDETEALLLGQFLALQESGMKCLRNAHSQSMFYHTERLFSLATKLLNTANQTMQAVLKYRSGGQQTVQVIHVHNEGQAIVAQNISSQSRRGIQEKILTEPHGSL